MILSNSCFLNYTISYPHLKHKQWTVHSVFIFANIAFELAYIKNNNRANNKVAILSDLTSRPHTDASWKWIATISFIVNAIITAN